MLNQTPSQKGTRYMQSSRSPDRLSVTFDDDHAVAGAGLLLPATLAQHLELRGSSTNASTLVTWQGGPTSETRR